MVAKAQVLLITLKMAQFYSSVPISHDSATVSQHTQHRDPETAADKWDSAIIKCILFTPVLFLTVTCQIAACEKGPIVGNIASQ